VYLTDRIGNSRRVGALLSAVARPDRHQGSVLVNFPNTGDELMPVGEKAGWERLVKRPIQSPNAPFKDRN
jgi:hypothetical protein